MKRLPAILLSAIIAIVLGLPGLTSKPSEAQTLSGPFVYSVKFVCGVNPGQFIPRPPNEASVKPGNYATAINIHNFRNAPITIRKKAVLARPQGLERLPPTDFDSETLEGNRAVEVNCSNIVQMFGTQLPFGFSFITGFVEIISPAKLSVVAVYTAQACRVGLTTDDPVCPSNQLGDVGLSVVAETLVLP